MKNVPHTVTDAAIATIRERIEAGVYPVGSLLPAQRQLSEELAISRASLREALSTLEALGLLMIRPGKGVYVESAQATAAQSWRFAEQSSLPDTYQMRFALEGFVARMAARAVSDSDLAWFEDNIAAMQTALACDELDEAARLDYDFHMRIVGIAGNAAIESILSSAAEIMKESQRMPFYRRELVLSTYTEHRAILDALKARDSAAAGKAIETHISNAAQRAGVYFPTPQA
ncbi:HTH-type transcriptional regulator LutR [Paraburkholderia domus]|jgi:Transcriptional regulators|uniref:HTH-type transcriptional regulator LutR n=1 Tax=Paraburkholderia domus TaxID=2793075 RepID=A0A9N8R1X5_9BURK|nr:FadR/GntR family transcriptional regulator [Paraburkholderia domus]MBK5050668.1 FadR family transcriptional regulator [Burkholderia sp. R-70006]MBK5059448.1 FadR family transcriptional regulator [Burkholderia sp. R-70199]MBK5086946.1 FadR family transcriptional regulator [Burkholderia sp. R-69927]MBK5119540.1 FadR family transcriptional regulator [Burkholderia sp. R-69980]MBK5167589.1 FadR family transcriptional regulator [Burkholderia sp. R-70211]MBK5183105.1 FadR family transcriptional r